MKDMGTLLTQARAARSAISKFEQVSEDLALGSKARTRNGYTKDIIRYAQDT